MPEGERALLHPCLSYLLGVNLWQQLERSTRHVMVLMVM